MSNSGYLVLADGTVYQGDAFGAEVASSVGEVVFTTAMTGHIGLSLLVGGMLIMGFALNKATMQVGSIDAGVPMPIENFSPPPDTSPDSVQ